MKNKNLINTNLKCSEKSYLWLCKTFENDYIRKPENGMFYVINIHPTIVGNKITVSIADAGSPNVLESTAI